MAGDDSIWVAVLDLDGAGTITPVNGLLPSVPGQARLLVRWHGAPLGYVRVPSGPPESLAVRARAAAMETLAPALRRHAAFDSLSEDGGHPPDCVARIACPRHFPRHSETGVTVAVCTRNRAVSLGPCLRSLQRVSYQPIEFLIVDNAPSDTTARDLVAALARADPRFRYTCEPAPGLSHARNHALTQAHFDVVAFTDDDTLPDPGWPSALVAGLTADPDTTCVTGLVASGALDTRSERYFDARYILRTSFEPRRFDLNGCRHPARLYPFAAGVFGTGANFAVRRSAIAGLGGFDPLLGAGAPGQGGEDLDMFLRVILAGGRICYVPAALVWHLHRSDAGVLGEQVYAYGHGLGAYLAKHLANPDLKAALIGAGLRHTGSLAVGMWRASWASQLRWGGIKMALNEASGLAAGMVRYRRAHRVQASSPGQP